ncbi:MAG: hypothetical protein J6J35_07810 [Alphaproteobacteria bacterium]|nr:hypothetical protein [Alphaproteobacteria bacterium]
MPEEPKIFNYETLQNTPAEKLPEIISQYDIIELECIDLSAYEKLHFKDDAKVNIAGKEPLPPQIDFTNCSEVILSGRDTSKIPPQKLKEGSSFYYMPRNSETNFYLNNLPPLYPNVDISRCQNVTIVSTDLKNIPDLKFKDGANINLSGCQNLPKNLDLSKCAAVSLSGCDLSTLKNITFKENAVIDLSDCDLSQIKNITFPKGASVILSGAQNLPENLDFSKCAAVSLSGCDLSTIKNIKFKEESSVNLSNCTNFPENLDLSKCAAVSLSGCDLSTLNDLKFKEDSSVDLSECTNFKKDLDLSQCASVSLKKCDINNINLKFKDGAFVDLSQTAPVAIGELDLSNCDYVNLSKANLLLVDDIKFKDNAKVNLDKAQNLPDIDVSNLSVVDLSSCDLNEIKNLTFKDNAEINLSGAQNIPENLDVSNCKTVWLHMGNAHTITAGDANIVLGGIGAKQVDVSNLKNFTISDETHEMYGENYISMLTTKSITFKDQQQYEEFLQNPKNKPLPKNCKVLFKSDENLKTSLKEQTGEVPTSSIATARTVRLNKALERKEQEAPAQSHENTPNTSKVPLTTHRQNTR